MKKKAQVTRVFLIRNKNELYMMLRNGKSASHGQGIKRWITPGGTVDEGEEPIDAAIRETIEEVGIQLKKEDLRLFFQKYDPVFDADMYFYLAENVKEKPVLQEPEKFDKVSWVKFKDISSLEKPGVHVGMFIEEAVGELKVTSSPPAVYKNW